MDANGNSPGERVVDRFSGTRPADFWLSVAMDVLGRILLVRSESPPEPWPVAQYLVARWLDQEGQVLTDAFRPSDELYSYPAAPYLQPLVGGGLALQGGLEFSWSRVIPSGTSNSATAPDWLSRQSLRWYWLIHGQRAYLSGVARQTGSDPEAYEVLSSSGTSCAKVRVIEVGAACSDGISSVGVDGTFIWQSRRTLMTNDGDTSTAFSWWSSLFK
jgi:hypothetical protein